MGSTRSFKRSARHSERSEESASMPKDKILRFAQHDGCFAQDDGCFAQDGKCFAQDYRAQFEPRHKINARQQMATIGE